ncbi:MAG: hypothetical protein A2017_17060 [Lentisphaerae bacterium GWF2_44_16]|nr:MAG: hypothetical protein A2017_17060 [Lentisphaerae bacterium GWF2_44_16]
MLTNKSLAFKLSLYILTCTILIFIVVFTHNWLVSRRLLLKSLEDNAQNLAISTANKLDQFFISASAAPSNIALYLEISSPTEKEILEYQSLILKNSPEIYGICIAFEPYRFHKKSLLFAPYFYRKTPAEIVYMDISNDASHYFYADWYQIPKEINKPLWSEPYFDDGAGNVLMSTYSVPFYKNTGKEKKFTGIVTADISLSWLQKQVASLKFFKSGYGFLISKYGSILTFPDPGKIMNDTIFSMAEEEKNPELRKIGREMTKGKSGFVPFHSTLLQRKCWMYYTPLKTTDWALAVVFPEDELFAELSRLHWNIIFLSSCGILILFLMIIAISHKITSPLRKLALLTKDIGSGHFDIQQLPELDRNDEIGGLSRAFASMQKSLSQYIKNLQETTAAKERIESELSIARDIQRSIIPKLFPAFPECAEFDVYAILESAKAVGGDLYDFFFIDDDHLFFSVGDVSGKGVPASLFMAVTQTLFRATAKKHTSAGEMVSNINKDLCRDNEMSMFVTYFLCILNIRTGELEFCNAGHNPPYIINHKSGELKQLRKIHGLPLGTFERPYTSEKITISAGDTIILYSDGVTEAFNAADEQFSDPRLESLIRENKNLSARQLAELILSEVKKFANGCEQSDDITIEVLTYHGLKK